MEWWIQLGCLLNDIEGCAIYMTQYYPVCTIYFQVFENHTIYCTTFQYCPHTINYIAQTKILRNNIERLGAALPLSSGRVGEKHSVIPGSFLAAHPISLYFALSLCLNYLSYELLFCSVLTANPSSLSGYLIELCRWSGCGVRT